MSPPPFKTHLGASRSAIAPSIAGSTATKRRGVTRCSVERTARAAIEITA
jgi:hypothetical protein